MEERVQLLTTDRQIEDMIGNSIIALGECRQRELNFDKLLKISLVDKHKSIMEYINLTFRIYGISYNSHVHLIRHRLTTPMCQSSRRINHDIDILIPDSVKAVLDDDALEQYISDVKKMYNYLIDNDVPPEDTRYLLPQGLKINMAIHMNLREFMHIMELRLAPNAHWEIRNIVGLMKNQCELRVLLNKFI